MVRVPKPFVEKYIPRFKKEECVGIGENVENYYDFLCFSMDKTQDFFWVFPNRKVLIVKPRYLEDIERPQALVAKPYSNLHQVVIDCHFIRNNELHQFDLVVENGYITQVVSYNWVTLHPPNII